MPAAVRTSPAARSDLLQQFLYLGRSSVPRARRFLRAADETMAWLAEMPEAGSPWESTDPALAGLRYWPIRRFKDYFLFYRPVSDGIEVVRVLHAAQDIEHAL
jgi:toxin ParE1/3/4